MVVHTVIRGFNILSSDLPPEALSLNEPKLRALFDELDEDGNGSLSPVELKVTLTEHRDSYMLSKSHYLPPCHRAAASSSVCHSFTLSVGGHNRDF